MGSEFYDEAEVLSRIGHSKEALLEMSDEEIGRVIEGISWKASEGNWELVSYMHHILGLRSE